MEKLKNKHFLEKLLSVLLAVGLWLYVVYAENPESEFWLRNIPITYVNTEQLSQNSLFLLENDAAPKTISIKVKGRRRDTSLLNASNISAQVSLAEIYSAGEYSLPVSIKFPIDGLEVTDKNPYSIPVTVDNIIETSKNIRIAFTGTPEENHSPGTAVAEPSAVRISGPSSIVKTIKEAVATVDIDTASADILTTVSVALVSNDGTLYSGGNVTLHNERVDVAVPILLTKTVPIVPMVENAYEYNVKSITTNPETVEIKGTSLVINNIHSIETAPVTITSSSAPLSIPVSLVMPEDVEQIDTELSYVVEITFNGHTEENPNNAQ